MSAVRAAGVVVGLVLVAGAMGGGVVKNPDGTINPGDTLQTSSDIGGRRLGQSLDSVGESVGRGAGSTLSSSKIVKAGALGAGAYGAAKYGPKIKNRYSTCWQRKSCDATPIEQPDPVGDAAAQLGVAG